MSEKLELVKTELKELAPEGYLSAERRDRIIDSIVGSIERVTARVKRTRDIALKAMFMTFKRTPTPEAKAIKAKIDAEAKKITEANEEYNEADKAAYKEYDDVQKTAQKALDEAKKVYDKAVNDARSVLDKARSKASKDLADVTGPANDKLAELKEDLVAAGFTTDSDERTGMRPLRRSKDENLLGGPLAEEVNAEAAAKVARLEDLASEITVTVEVGGTNLEEKLNGISASVKEVADGLKSAKKS